MTSSNRQTRKRQRTGNHIAEVAFALFEAQGYDVVTMERIAATAEVSRGTLYNHFPVKEAVLAHSIHAQLAHDLESLLPAIMRRTGFRGRVSMLFKASAEWWDAHRGYLAPYVRHRFQQVGMERRGHDSAGSDMLAMHVRLIEAAQLDGELDKEVSAMRLATYLHFLYLSALMSWLDEPGLSLAGAFVNALDFFCRGASVQA